MKDVRRSARGGHDGVAVAQVAALDVDFSGERLEVALEPGREVVEDAHVFAARDELGDDVGTDETGAAGDEPEAAQGRVLALRSSSLTQCASEGAMRSDGGMRSRTLNLKMNHSAATPSRHVIFLPAS